MSSPAPITTRSGNPWISIWTRPRETMQQVLASPKLRSYVPWLAAAGGADSALSKAMDKSMGDTMPLVTLVPLCFVVGGLFGYIGLLINVPLTHWAATRLGSKVSKEDMKAAIGWGMVPGLWGALLWFPAIAVVGSDLFTTETPRIAGSIGVAVTTLMFGILGLIAGVWSMVTSILCLSEVTKLSIWKAVLASLLAWFVLVGITVIVVGGIVAAAVALT